MPKIMTICSNSFNSSNANGRTLMNLLYNSNPENLAEFYISNDYPNFEKCGTYYRITDNEAIKSLLGKKVGSKVANKNSEIKSQNSFKLIKFKNSFLINYIRKKIWGLNLWQNKDFWNWIEDFNPEVILLFSGNNAFLDKIAWQISKKYNIPIVLFNCEDYYFQPFRTNNFFEKMNKKFCDKVFEETMKIVGGVVYNSHKIKDSYDKIFPNADSIVCYQPGTKFNINEKKNGKIVYLGNINDHRLKPLIEIANILKERGLNFDLYGPLRFENSEEILNNQKNIIYHGMVSYEECKKIMEEASIVIHCDNLDNAWELKHAMSCKTGDCLSCGTPLFAYGPKESAVMDYYIKNNCAMVCTSREELQEKLFEALDNKDLMKNYLNNALNLAKENHNIEKTSTKFYNFVDKIIKSFKEKNESINI